MQAQEQFSSTHRQSKQFWHGGDYGVIVRHAICAEAIPKVQGDCFVAKDTPRDDHVKAPPC